MAPAIRLKVGDKVSVKGLDAFNIDWLRINYPRNWQNVRFDGVVGALLDGKWQIDFDDGETQTLTRNKVRYESRPASSGLLNDTLHTLSPGVPAVHTVDRENRGRKLKVTF